MKRLRCAFAPLTLAAAAVTAAAHPIVIHPGTIAWDEHGLAITLELDAHAMEHVAAAVGPEMSTPALAAALARSLEVHTPAGHVLSVSDARWEGPDCVHMLTRIPPGPDALALRLRPTGALTALREQWQLLWTRESSARRLIRLTAAGNVAVIRRYADAEADRDRLTAPLLTLSARNASAAPMAGSTAPHWPFVLLIQLDVPCALLPGWAGVLVSEGPIVTGARLAAAEKVLTDWISTHLSVRSAKGEGQPLSVNSSRLVTVDDEVIPSDGNAPHSVLTTRVRTLATAALLPAHGGIDLSWDGFNPAVLRLPAAYRLTGASHRIADLTSADPHIRIRFSKNGENLLVSAPGRHNATPLTVRLRGDGTP